MATPLLTNAAGRVNIERAASQQVEPAVSAGTVSSIRVMQNG
jgi:hypothetical protein